MWKCGRQSNLFLTNEGVFSEDETSLNIENDIINDEKHLIELFNEHYINNVQTTCWKKITSIGDASNPKLDKTTVDESIEKYNNHPSIFAIKDSFYSESLLDSKANAEGINKYQSSKATGTDCISAKVY